MIQFNFRRFSFIMILLSVTLMALMFTGCRTKKSVIDKKQETVSTLEKKDIKISETSKLKSDTFTLSDSESWSIRPVNEDKQVTMIRGKDTLKFTNATIDFNKNKSETTANILNEKNRDYSDTGTSSFDSKTTEKKKDVKVESASWGSNLGIIFGIVAALVLLYFHLKKP